MPPLAPFTDDYLEGLAGRVDPALADLYRPAPAAGGLIALHGGRLAHRIGPDHGTRREIRIPDPGHFLTGRHGGR